MTEEELIRLANTGGPGGAEAEFHLGALYYRSNPPNYPKAMEWIEKAATHGHSQACAALGCEYIRSKNYEKALIWLEKASQLENSEAFRLLGYMHREGLGVPKNIQKALQFYEESAKRNNPDAQNFLGNIYFSGKSRVHDSKKALKWFTEAFLTSKRKNYQQSVILSKLTQFCSLYQTEYKLSHPFIATFREGHCAGLAALFMISAYQTKKGSETKLDTPMDNLKHFYSILDTLIEWDNTKTMSLETQKNILSFLKKISSYHSPKYPSFGQANLEKQVFFAEDKERSSLQKELKVTLNLPQAELANKLKLLGIPPLLDRMVSVLSSDHALALFEYSCYRPNSPSIYSECKTAEEMAEKIFEEMEFRSDQPHILSIQVYSHLSSPKIHYPEYQDILRGCVAESKQDPTKSTPLHQCAFTNAIESALYYLKEEKTDINAKNVWGYTPLHIALMNNQVEMARLLLLKGAKNEEFPLLPDIYDLFDEQLNIKFGKHLLKQLAEEKNKNLASTSIQKLINQGFLTKLSASYLSKEERKLLEIIIFVSNQLNIPLSLPREKFDLNKQIIQHFLKQIHTNLPPDFKTDDPNEISAQTISAFSAALREKDINKININTFSHHLENEINHLPLLSTNLLNSFCKMLERCDEEKEIFSNHKRTLFSTPSLIKLQELKRITSAKKPPAEILKDAKKFIKNTIEKLSTKSILNLEDGENLTIDRQKLINATEADKIFVKIHEALENPVFLIPSALNDIPRPPPVSEVKNIMPLS